MATVNIRREISDPFYRYKMERLQSKIEGKGNGIKTVIVNLSSVAQSLSRPASFVIKYFGFELGAQTNTNPADDRWIINGAHEASKLQDYLDGFITKFVLCKKCKNPETDVVIKDGSIVLDCKACGQRSTVDLRLKLSSFILKNQPKKGKKDKSKKKEKKKSKKENGDAEQNGNSHTGSGDNNSNHADNDEEEEEALAAGSDDELTRRINAEAKELDPLPEKDEVWTVDVSDEAVRARAKKLRHNLKKTIVVVEGEDESEGGIAYDQLGRWVSSTAESKTGGINDVGDAEIAKKMKELHIQDHDETFSMLAQNIFDDNIVTQIPGRVTMLKTMITTESREMAFLGGIERLVGAKYPKLLPQISKIFLAFYQEDVISEQVFVDWGSKDSTHLDPAISKKARESAAPFLEWLKTAAEDEESGDEE